MHLNIYLLSIYSCIHAYACGYKLIYIKVETLCWESMGFCQVVHSMQRKKNNIDFLMLRLDVV